MIYWFIGSGNSSRKLFSEYWKRCCERGDTSDSKVFIEMVGQENFAELEERWKAWVLILEEDD
ncbi:MAG: hypothetical protein ABIH42_03605 [Planctomycetota bacterium]